MTRTIREHEQDPGIVARVRILAWIALGLFVLIFGRLYWLQVVRHERFQTLSENNRLRIRAIRAPRGVIMDRRGRPLAETQPAFDLLCYPVDVRDPQVEVGLLSEMVSFDADEVLDKILSGKEDNPYSGVTVAMDLSFDQVSMIEFNREALPGFSIQVEAKRSYPYGKTFAHVLGYVGEVSESELAAAGDERVGMGDIVGKYGLENVLDGAIRGLNGGRYVEVDASGRDKRMVNEVSPVTGATVRTTLDLDLQNAAAAAMEGKAGAVIAMNPKKGDILVFLSAPAFDPNVFSRGILKEEWKALIEDPRKPMQNKGLQGTYAPGSTVKPFVALAALENGLQDPAAKVGCGGSYTLGNRSFRCWKEKGHGPVDMYRAIVQSCDVYFYRLGVKVGPDRIAAVEKGAGMGVLSGIGLPGERKGLVPDTAWKQETGKGKWMDVESLLVGIGQGAIHVTPLGMMSGYSALATGGLVMRPRLVTRVASGEGRGEEIPPEVERRNGWSSGNVAFIRRALSGVVNDYGTGGSVKLPGIEVGGKTGTAQVAAVKGKMIKSEHLPYNIRDHAWFVGFAPVGDPEICVVAMVEHGGHGASAAAPIVRAVMEAYFRDRLPPKPTKEVRKG